MLPKGNAAPRDITLSAHIRFNGDPLNFNNRNNYRLKEDPFPNEIHEDTLKIDTIGIEVIYTDVSDLAIDWIRLETKPARDLWRGYWDDVLAGKLQMDLDSLTAPVWANRGIAPYRWYTRDEPTRMYWHTNNYLNHRFGQVFTNEHNPKYSVLMHYYCNYPENWMGAAGFTATNTIVPFYKQGSFHPNDGTFKWQHLSIKNGWGVGSWHISKAMDTLASGYETVLYNQTKTFLAAQSCPSYDSLRSYAGGMGALQIDYEKDFYRNYFDSKNNDFLYSSKPWWGQTFLLGEWTNESYMDGGVSKQHIKYANGCRNLTAEELRLFTAFIKIFTFPRNVSTPF